MLELRRIIHLARIQLKDRGLVRGKYFFANSPTWVMYEVMNQTEDETLDLYGITLVDVAEEVEKELAFSEY